jgi:hypothetical protein
MARSSIAVTTPDLEARNDPFREHPVGAQAYTTPNGINGDTERSTGKRKSGDDANWDQDWGDDDTYDVDDLDPDSGQAPVDMDNRPGQSTVKGGSEMVRMILLTFNAVGMT